MIYIYNDYGGTHTTSLAAAYHLNKLPVDRKLTKEEILRVDYFNKLQTSDMGKLIFHGVDENRDSVYTIGRGSSKVVVPALKNLSVIFQGRYQANETIVFSNTSPTVPFAMTIGGLLSRRLKIDFIGVPLLVLGAKQCCKNILQLVTHTKKTKKTKTGSIIVLENKDVPLSTIENQLL
ncbi:DUF3189 family protein [Paenibacillus allorhizosphaerae]|uniref:DUF3189 family protein n=1 Tax=Paenibacillus allorhizosphaerae TaxID=2849866 RepID=A0ABM8VTW7_9BACL|nr:DUF3189 family protein [Paenibacillus allorhizosphaerae]CAG7658172.1 hypothetical protein PAECIP111802_06972 [Paenibacillus allorhizosphaerae]